MPRSPEREKRHMGAGEKRAKIKENNTHILILTVLFILHLV